MSRKTDAPDEFSLRFTRSGLKPCLHVNCETLDGGRLTVAAEYLPLLRAHRLDTFDRIMALNGGKTARDFPGRQTVRLEFARPTGDEPAQGIYLKRYQPQYLSLCRRWLRWWGWPAAQDEAWREWQGLQAMHELGIATPIPIAVGQQRAHGMVTRSFLITAEVRGGMEGGVYARDLTPSARRRFLERVAALVRKFHQAGWVHKDLYISHVLAVPPVAPARDADLVLIDLQRVSRPCCWRQRWVVKDLGALAYSALKSGASPRDLLRAYLEYRGKPRFEPSDRAFARRILRR